MLTRSVRASSICSVILHTTAAAQTGVEMLQPIKPWVLNYADTECFAERQYGDPSAPVVLAFKASVTGEVYDVLVARPGSAPRLAEHRDGTIDFGQGPVKISLLQYAPKKQKLVIQKYRLTGPTIAQARQATTVRFTVKDGPDAAFKLQAMPALFKTMDHCIADLRQHWNGDGLKTGLIAQSAKGDLRHVFKADDYPNEAIWRDQEGTVILTLLIDEKGSVAACDILVPSGVPALDAMGCQVVRERLKLKPALDKSGKPVRSIVVTPPITWRMSG